MRTSECDLVNRLQTPCFYEFVICCRPDEGTISMNHDLTAEKRETLANKWTDILKVPVTCCSCIFGQFLFFLRSSGCFLFHPHKHDQTCLPIQSQRWQALPGTALHCGCSERPRVKAKGTARRGTAMGEETRDVAMELTTSMLDVSTSLPLE